ncbi:MAG: hypothetical protein ACETWK_09125 [Candidatus Aminicenantaceae bacterium]
MNKKIIVIAGLLILYSGLQGIVPQKWELRNKDDFLKGKLDGISISFDGILSLSPKEEEIEGPAEDFYLSFLLTSQGVIYLGTGHSGRIYEINSQGKAELYFQTPEMDVTCLVQDRKGNIYAGTSPNGKVYKITDKEKGDVFFNPAEKYIWDLLFIDNDNLLAAVGETGGIYEINKEGEGRLVLEAEENHILCLKKDTEGNLIAGSGGNGLLYRISPQRKAIILFESPYEEIKSIAFDDRGNIYAAAGGTITKPEKEEAAPALIKSATDITITVTPASSPSEKRIPSFQKQPSTLYKVSPEGMAKRLWSSSEDLIYTLLWDTAEKRLLFGTGNKGRIFTVDRDEKISLLIQKNSEQVYYLQSFDTRIYVLSNNPSGLSLMYPEQRFGGEYTSHVLDSKILSSWGRISWEAELPSGTTLQFQTRSGNSKEPNQTWSDWSPPYQKTEGELILSPKARYLQLKVMFKSQSGKLSPLLETINLFYLQSNVAPLITKLELLAPNKVYLKPPVQEEVIWGYEEDIDQKSSKEKESKTYVVMKKVDRKGFQTIEWGAIDQNEDSLVYSLFIRRENENKWRVLKEKWSEEIIAFDTLSFPDGVYFVKLVASDLPSNPPGYELETEKISQPLIIDNSLPVVGSFQAEKNKDTLEVTFETEDSLSYIKEVKYLVRPDEWRTVFPVDGICDSKKEAFKISVKLLPNSDNLISVKVKDSHHNIGVYRHTF